MTTPNRKNPTTLTRKLSYMTAVVELERDLADACELAQQAILNNVPDDFVLAEKLDRWTRTLVRSRSLCRQPRPRSVVDRIAGIARNGMRSLRGGAA